MLFLDYFPDNCPPRIAQPASGRVYYLVKNDPPTPEDFFAKRQKNPRRRFSNNEQECRACGISVYTEIEDILNIRRIYPGLENLKVAVGDLIPNFGVIQHTSSTNSPSHHTLWLAVGAEVWTVFQVINMTQ
ncbi:hypothetical protein ACE1CI_02990 [Aerosakkonemataceae cyanobacterium BLCC-F50]|uniref:Uncharacterized protein n=1 Tax=Floridaenema flaviceps BLCC-F50 TaxID=3153642 RepID=A0ABV4XJK8_9CYAN